MPVKLQLNAIWLPCPPTRYDKDLCYSLQHCISVAKHRLDIFDFTMKKYHFIKVYFEFWADAILDAFVSILRTFRAYRVLLAFIQQFQTQFLSIDRIAGLKSCKLRTAFLG